MPGFALCAAIQAVVSKAEMTRRLPDTRQEAGRLAAQLVREDRDWCLLLHELWSTTVRDPRLRRRFAEHHEVWRSAIEEFLAAQAEATCVELAVPADWGSLGGLGALGRVRDAKR